VPPAVEDSRLTNGTRSWLSSGFAGDCAERDCISKTLVSGVARFDPNQVCRWSKRTIIGHCCGIDARHRHHVCNFEQRSTHRSKQCGRPQHCRAFAFTPRRHNPLWHVLTPRNIPASPRRDTIASSDPTSREGMGWIAGGAVRMGSDRHYPVEAPAHDVSVEPSPTKSVAASSTRPATARWRSGRLTRPTIPALGRKCSRRLPLSSRILAYCYNW
jgi:hypothetical protein